MQSPLSPDPAPPNNNSSDFEFSSCIAHQYHHHHHQNSIIAPCDEATTITTANGSGHNIHEDASSNYQSCNSSNHSGYHYNCMGSHGYLQQQIASADDLFFKGKLLPLYVPQYTNLHLSTNSHHHNNNNDNNFNGNSSQNGSDCKDVIHSEPLYLAPDQYSNNTSAFQAATAIPITNHHHHHHHHIANANDPNENVDSIDKPSVSMVHSSNNANSASSRNSSSTLMAMQQNGKRHSDASPLPCTTLSEALRRKDTDDTTSHEDSDGDYVRSSKIRSNHHRNNNNNNNVKCCSKIKDLTLLLLGSFKLKSLLNPNNRASPNAVTSNDLSTTNNEYESARKSSSTSHKDPLKLNDEQQQIYAQSSDRYQKQCHGGAIFTTTTEIPPADHDQTVWMSNSNSSSSNSGHWSPGRHSAGAILMSNTYVGAAKSQSVNDCQNSSNEHLDQASYYSMDGCCWANSSALTLTLTPPTDCSVAPGRASLSVDPHYLLMYQDHENHYHHHRLNHSKENRFTLQNVHQHQHKNSYGAVRHSHNGKLMRARSLEGYKSLNANPNPNASTGRSGSLSPKTLQRKKYDTLKASSRQIRSDGGSYGWRAKSNSYNSLERSSSYSNMMRVAPVLNVPNMVTIRSSSSSSKSMGMQSTNGSFNKDYHYNTHNPNPNSNHAQQSVNNGGSSVSYGGGFSAGILANLFSTSSSSIKGMSKKSSYPSTTKPKSDQTAKNSSSSSMNNRSSRSSSSSSSSFSSFNSSSSNNSSTSESSHASSSSSSSSSSSAAASSCKVLLPAGIRRSRKKRNSPPP